MGGGHYKWLLHSKTELTLGISCSTTADTRRQMRNHNSRSRNIRTHTRHWQSLCLRPRQTVLTPPNQHPHPNPHSLKRSHTKKFRQIRAKLAHKNGCGRKLRQPIRSGGDSWLFAASEVNSCWAVGRWYNFLQVSRDLYISRGSTAHSKLPVTHSQPQQLPKQLCHYYLHYF